MSVAALARGRAMAERQMLDTGVARHPNGTKVYNPATQRNEPGYDDLFTSRCKLQARNVAALVQEVGGRTATTVRFELHLPVESEPLTVGDVWEMTAVAAVSTAVVGHQYRVTAPVEGTFRTARRYEVERLVS